jgi:hypothetical protein
MAHLQLADTNTPGKKNNNVDFADGEVLSWERGVQPGPLFNCREGLSVDRWNFWKDRLKVMQGQLAVTTQGVGEENVSDGLVEDVRAAMTLALDRMKKAEKEDIDPEEGEEAG